MQLLDRRLADRAAQHAVRADPAHERPRVDVVDRDDALLLQPLRPRGTRRPHDDGLGLDTAGLHPRRIDAVVADERVGEAEHLGHVARIGRRLLVARARGREAGLARRHAGGADGPAGESGSVLEDEVGEALHHLHITQDLY